MHYIATADTDIGKRNSNQDSLLIRHGRFDSSEVLLAVVCDGMGGLEKGELASATVVRRFQRWFDEELPFELESFDPQSISEKWINILRQLNDQIFLYGERSGIMLGTTFTGILFNGSSYVIGHVGDTRAYHINTDIKQLTEDHTYIAREIARGNMTPKQAKTDKNRNMLLQCVGASERLDPQIVIGNTEQGVYMLCSDGFRHEISDEEMKEAFYPLKLSDRDIMHTRAVHMIELNKQRNEKDNISVILIKVD